MTFTKTSFEEQLTLYIKYTQGLRLVDTFWEDYIVNATIYTISFDHKVIGCFSIYEEEHRLTFLEQSFTKQAQSIFADIINQYHVICALVVTNDELFLSLCLESQVKIELQAYFFDYIKKPQKPATYPSTQLKRATEADLEELRETNFFDDLSLENDADVKYVLRDENGGFLGAGHIHTMQLSPQWGACGMVVAEKHRQKGVGRSIILHLTKIVKENGLTPIAGCWYYNFNSKHTLESCGYASKTRLLSIHF